MAKQRNRRKQHEAYKRAVRKARKFAEIQLGPSTDMRVVHSDNGIFIKQGDQTVEGPFSTDADAWKALDRALGVRK